MKREVNVAFVGIIIGVLVVLIGVVGYFYLRTPGPKVPIQDMPVPKNPYKAAR